MRPWLVEWPVPGLGTFAISGYFTALCVGLVAAAHLFVRGSTRRGVSAGRALIDAAWLVGGGLVGARLAHMITVAPGRYLENPILLLRFWEGGLVFYGGLLAGLAVAWWRWRRHPWAGWAAADAAAPALAAGLGFGRLGCFAAGCCYGRPIDWPTGQEWPWGVVFLQGQVPTALKGVPLHPTQLYESFAAFLLAAGLWFGVRHDGKPGRRFALLLVAYATLRSINELFRLDLERGFLFESLLGQRLSTSQGISIPLFLTGLWILVRRRGGEHETIDERRRREERARFDQLVGAHAE